MILLLVWAIPAAWLFAGYVLWLLDRASRWTDYVGVVVGSLGLAALWPLYLVAMVGRFTSQKHGGGRA